MSVTSPLCCRARAGEGRVLALVNEHKDLPARLLRPGAARATTFAEELGRVGELPVTWKHNVPHRDVADLVITFRARGRDCLCFTEPDAAPGLAWVLGGAPS